MNYSTSEMREQFAAIRESGTERVEFSFTKNNTRKSLKYIYTEYEHWGAVLKLPNSKIVSEYGVDEQTAIDMKKQAERSMAEFEDAAEGLLKAVDKIETLDQKFKP